MDRTTSPTDPTATDPSAPVTSAGTSTSATWGLVDVGFGLAAVIVSSAVAGLLAVLVAWFVADPRPAATAGAAGADGLALGALAASPAVLAIGLVGQQAAQGLWPWAVARRKGRGVVPDFGLRLESGDLRIGLAGGAVVLALSAAVGWVAAEAVGLESRAEASNTGFLAQAGSGFWFVVLALAVVVGAPLSEELFFRGLVLRVAGRRLGRWAAVAASTLVFTAVHWHPMPWQGQVVLLSSIVAIGLMLAAMAVRFGRLGPGIVAHGALNAVALLAAVA